MTWQRNTLTGQSKSHLLAFNQHWIHRDVIRDLECLIAAANEAGFDLSLASAFRDFERQSLIWDQKFSGKRSLLDANGNLLDSAQLTTEQKIHAILKWSALPGGSRHHWGTDFDVYARNQLPEKTDLQLEPWEYHTGHQSDFYQWLKTNLNTFGFFFPYDKDQGGVSAEPWHISHRQLSDQALSQLTLELLEQVIQESALSGKTDILKMLPSIYAQYICNICKD